MIALTRAAASQRVEGAGHQPVEVSARR